MKGGAERGVGMASLLERMEIVVCVSGSSAP